MRQRRSRGRSSRGSRRKEKEERGRRRKEEEEEQTDKIREPLTEVRERKQEGEVGDSISSSPVLLRHWSTAAD